MYSGLRSSGIRYDAAVGDLVAEGRWSRDSLASYHGECFPRT